MFPGRPGPNFIMSRRTLPRPGSGLESPDDRPTSTTTVSGPMGREESNTDLRNRTIVPTLTPQRLFRTQGLSLRDLSPESRLWLIGTLKPDQVQRRDSESKVNAFCPTRAPKIGLALVHTSTTDTWNGVYFTCEFFTLKENGG